MYRRHVLARLRLFNRNARRFLLHNVLHADDPPHRLALGAAIGIFITFTPTVGFQMVLIVFVSWLLRANKVIGLPLAWISNPLTMVPIFYFCYKAGAVMMGSSGVSRQWWRELARPPDGWWEGVTFYWFRLMEIALPLWTGCLVVATLLALMTYVVVNRLVRFYRLRRWGRLEPPTALQFKPTTAARANNAPKSDVPQS